MDSMTAESAVVEKGMRSLIDALGIVDAERFIVIMNRNKKNYDEWRNNCFDKMTPQEYKEDLFSFSRSLAQ